MMRTRARCRQMMTRTPTTRRASRFPRRRPNLESRELPWSGGAASKELRKFYREDSARRALDSIEMRRDNEDDARRRDENSTGRRTRVIEVSRSEATRRDYYKLPEEKCTLDCTRSTPRSNKRRKRRGRWPTTTRGGAAPTALLIWPTGRVQNAVNSIAGGTTRVSASRARACR